MGIEGIFQISDVRQSSWKGHCLGIAAFLVTFLLRVGLAAWMPHDRGFILFIPAVALTTLLCGIGPGIVTAAISGAAIYYFFLPPYRSFHIAWEGVVAFATYIVVVTIILVLVHRLQTTIIQLKEEREHSDTLAEREKLLIGELRHRTKNLFAVIHGLATRTFSDGRATPQDQKAFLGRLLALSRADERLLSSEQGKITLKEIIVSELGPMGAQYSIKGEDVLLDDKTAQNFALVIHELVTNAVKYGALSSNTGHINMHWVMNSETPPATLYFTWKERGGPTLTQQPRKKGFGTTLISSALGSSHFMYQPDGLCYEVEVQLPT